MRELERCQGARVSDLGDSADTLQALVDQGIKIPAGYYKMSRQVVIPPGYADYCGTPAVFDLCKPSQAECSCCGERRGWLAPDWSRLHRDVTLRCERCLADTAHHELPGRDVSPGRLRDADGNLDMDKVRCFIRATA